MKIDIYFLYKGIYVITFHRFTESQYILGIEVLLAFVGKRYLVIIDNLHQSKFYENVFFFHNCLFSQYALTDVGEYVLHRRSYV